MNYELEMLLPVVAELTQKYAAFESTSVSYEKAQSLMGAVIYCLNEYHNFCPDAPAAGKISITEQYHTGYELVLEKVRKTLDLFNRLSVQCDDFGIQNLHDTIQTGIPAFFKWYDARFCPQYTIITLDYPLLIDLSSLQGIDAVYQYVLFAQTEQAFLCAPDRNYILMLLEKYQPDYPHMMENICDIVLPDIIGRLAVRKPLDRSGFQPEDYIRLKEIFGQKPVSEIESITERLLKTMVGLYDKKAPEISAYVSAAIKNISLRIDTAIRFDHLEKLFLQ